MALQVGVWTKDPLLVSSLQKGSVSCGEAKIEFVEPNELKHPPKFQYERFSSKLSTRQIGESLLASPALPSTQTLLHQNFTRFPDGAICVADVQTSGKGRGSNTWTSPIGCLMFSVYKKLCISGERLPFVQYVVSLAIVGAIQEVCKQYVGEGVLDVRIKWPNDIYANKLKIGGILCQSVYRDGIFHLIIGSGLNVNNAEPTTCLASMISHLTGNDIPAGGISREDILAEIANRLEELLDLLAEKGFGPLKETYLRSWHHTGQNVVLEEEKGGEMNRVPLKITGISDNGYMTAVDSKGDIFELHPDGNSLDFFSGLVRHKKLN